MNVISPYAGSRMISSPADASADESLTVIFPAYNDAPSLPELIARTFATLDGYGAPFEVIVVNDGSHDDTAGVLQALETKYSPHMRVITHPVNRGYGGALRTGFEAAANDLVFYTDGDGQYDVRELPKLLELMSANTGLVNGYKLERNDPQHRIWIGSVYNTFARALFGIRIRDVDCDFRLFRRELIQSTPLTSTSGTICVELVRRLEQSDFAVVEVGVHHYSRQHGSSQFFRIRSLFQTFRQLVRLYVQLSGSPAPRRAQLKRASPPEETGPSY